MARESKKDSLRKLLREVITRKALIKALEKKMLSLQAKLQMDMDKAGIRELQDDEGGSATFRPDSRTSFLMDIDALLKTLDPRTLAALVAGSSVNKAKVEFLERAFQGKTGFRKLMLTKRSERFIVDPPRSKESKAAVSAAIQKDMEAEEEKIKALLEGWAQAEGTKPLPENKAVDAALEKPKKKKAAKKKKATKKKKGKK
jgi:hypothetical protein